MLRTMIRVLAIIGLLISVAIGAFAAKAWLTPSDEQLLYEQKHQEAMEKLRKAEAAKGTPAEAILAKEARESAASAEVWGRGYRERIVWNRLGVVASCGSAFVCLIVLALTFIKRKKNTAAPPTGSWNNPQQSAGYGGYKG